MKYVTLILMLLFAFVMGQAQLNGNTNVGNSSSATSETESICSLDNLTGEMVDCENSRFYVQLHYDYSGGAEDGFTIAINGEYYKSYDAGTESVLIGPLWSTDDSDYEFVMIDKDDNTCRDTTMVSSVDCPNTCDYTNVVSTNYYDYDDNIETIENEYCTSVQYDLDFDFDESYELEVIFFSDYGISSRFVGDPPYHWETNTNFVNNFILVHEVGNPCCMLMMIDGQSEFCIEGTENTFSGKFFPSLDPHQPLFEHTIEMIADDYFNIHLNVIPLHSYFSEKNGSFVLGVDIFVNDDLAKGNFVPAEDFNGTGLTIGPFAADGLTDYELKYSPVCSSDDDVSYITNIGTVGEPPLCIMNEVLATPTECDLDGVFYVDFAIDFAAESIEENMLFNVIGNGEDFGQYEVAGDGLFQVGPLDGNTVDWSFEVFGTLHDTCKSSVDLLGVGCLGATCILDNINAVQTCTESLQAVIDFDFSENNSGYFELIVADQVANIYGYDELPITVGLPEGTTTIGVQDQQFTDCAMEADIQIPDCPGVGLEELKNVDIWMYQDGEMLNIRSSEKILGIELFDMSGQRILTENINYTEQEISIPIAQNVSGMYILRCQLEQGMVGKKILLF